VKKLVSIFILSSLLSAQASEISNSTKYHFEFTLIAPSIVVSAVWGIKMGAIISALEASWLAYELMNPEEKKELNDGLLELAATGETDSIITSEMIQEIKENETKVNQGLLEQGFQSQNFSKMKDSEIANFLISSKK